MGSKVKTICEGKSHSKFHISEKDGKFTFHYDDEIRSEEFEILFSVVNGDIDWDYDDPDSHYYYYSGYVNFLMEEHKEELIKLVSNLDIEREKKLLRKQISLNRKLAKEINARLEKLNGTK